MILCGLSVGIRWSDRSDANARALVVRMDCHSAWVVCPCISDRRVPGSTLEIERSAHRTMFPTAALHGAHSRVWFQQTLVPEFVRESRAGCS